MIVLWKQWRHHRGARGAATPPDSRFVTYGTPVRQVVNIIWIICKIMQTFYTGNSLLGDELAIAQQQIFDMAPHKGALQAT